MTLSVFDAAREAPLTEALVCDGVRLTFRDLAGRVQTRLEQLAPLGIDAHSQRGVALLVDGSLTMFELLYALIALGVPVLPIHPRLTSPERAVLLQTSAMDTVLDPSDLPSPLAPNVASALVPLQIPAERALALVPTSGSTGVPKLVELSRRAFFALAKADAERIPPLPADRALLCLPLSHVGGLSVVLRCLWARRTCVVFRPGSTGLLDALPELAPLLATERISLLSLVPAVLARLLREAPDFALAAPLRAVILGGQACSSELFAEARLRGVPALTSYGLTEACSQVCTLSPRQAAELGPDAVRKGAISSGFPLSGVELRVANGLVQVRGPTLLTGYVGAPSPFTDDGFFDTGDRAELDPEQGLFVFGRVSELIISGGENIDPSEVEQALLACGGLRAALVFGVPDAEFGARVAVALEPTTLSEFDERALFAALALRLASFKQPRSSCVFESLPRLPSGKLDRARIRDQAQARLRPAERVPRS